MVTPAQARAMLTMDATERKALCTGLEFAELLRLHFPDFFLDHVATSKVAYPQLLGVAGAFLSLAHNHLLTLDIERNAGVMISPKDPTEPLRTQGYYWYASNSAKNELSTGAYLWLVEPRPRVYGLGMETVAPDNAYRHYPPKPSAIEKHALALLIWRLLGDTRWAVLSETQAAELAIARVGNLDLGRAIATTLPLLRETPLRALCARLDADEPLGIRQLGTIIAYACKRTGNSYADTTMAEVRERYDTIIDLDWHRSAAHFARERAEQQVAAKWASAYSRLGGRFWKNRAMLADLVAVIERTAIDVSRGDDTDSGSPYDPHLLINRLDLDARRP